MPCYLSNPDVPDRENNRTLIASITKRHSFLRCGATSTVATMSWVPLSGVLVLLMIDSAIQLALISSMVGYLHRSGANQYPFESEDGSVALINAKPKGLLLNEGHTSNGASGTALILVCFGGFLVLWWQRRRERRVKFISEASQ